MWYEEIKSTGVARDSHTSTESNLTECKKEDEWSLALKWLFVKA